MRNTISILTILFTSLLGAQSIEDTTSEHSFTGNRPDGHAPISVMGDHTHAKGEFMISYRYSTTVMEDLLRGSDEVSFASVLRPNGGQYMVTPTEMTMNMHMLGAMYAPTDKLTLMAMTMFMEMDMDHLTGMGTTFQTASSGIGDTSLSALYQLYKGKRARIHGQLGVILPTGSIESMDVTPASMGQEVILPYPMQIGSGTFGTIIAATYTGQSTDFSWGTQLRGDLRFGRNDLDYRLGDRMSWNNWGAYKIAPFVSVSARLEALLIGDIQGANPDLNPNMVITADTANSGAEIINGGIGLNFYMPEGSLKGLRLGLEYTQPLAQSLSGVQLQNQEVLTAGLQYSF